MEQGQALDHVSMTFMTAKPHLRSGHVHAATSSFSVPRATTFIASSGSGRCNPFASSHDARIQTSRSSSVVRITGIAFGWIGSTMAFGAVISKRSSVRRRIARGVEAAPYDVDK